jgi:DNA invertase Pin-like site-specific DNA recombinase
MRNIGYARVSTTGQSFESQIDQLTAYGCQQIFQEKVSGAKSDRPQLARLLASLGDGDTLVVTRLDRLARSTFDLLNILKATSSSNAMFLSLNEPWVNTATPVGRLMVTVLAGVAEFERDLIELRTSEGRQRARRSGIKFGSKFKLSVHQMEEIRRRKEAGDSCRLLARS